jgi:tRNA A-37 threonylcarbamoyl transferase component Bud32
MKMQEDIRRFIQNARAGRGEAGKQKIQGLADIPIGQVFPVQAQKYHLNLNSPQQQALAKAAEEPHVEEKRLGGGAIGITMLRTAPNGYKYVWKKDPHFGKSAIDAEQVGPAVARLVGLDAPDVYRNSDDVIHMEFVDNAEVAKLADRKHPGIYDSDDAKRLAVLDFLIVNSDRHRGNWMIRDDGRIIPIDHGFAFEKGHDTRARRVKTPEDMKDYIRFATNTYRDSRLLRHVGTLAGELHDNPLTKADVAKLRIKIEAMRPALEKIGKGYFVDNMLMRLALLEPHAKGTKNLVP